LVWECFSDDWQGSFESLDVLISERSNSVRRAAGATTAALVPWGSEDAETDGCRLLAARDLGHGLLAV
jgi:hypothetical protein